MEWRGVSRRCKARHRRRVNVLRTALEAMVSIIHLAGLTRTEKEGHPLCRLSSQRQRDSSIEHCVACPSAPSVRAKTVFYCPRWVDTLFRGSNLASNLSLDSVWRRTVESARSFWRRRDSSLGGSTSLPLYSLLPPSSFHPPLSEYGDVLHDHYSIPVQDVDVLVTPLRAELVALPEVSHKPVHLQSLLPWPWNEIFS